MSGAPVSSNAMCQVALLVLLLLRAASSPVTHLAEVDSTDSRFVLDRFRSGALERENDVVGVYQFARRRRASCVTARCPLGFRAGSPCLEPPADAASYAVVAFDFARGIKHGKM